MAKGASDQDSLRLSGSRKGCENGLLGSRTDGWQRGLGMMRGTACYDALLEPFDFEDLVSITAFARFFFHHCSQASFD